MADSKLANPAAAVVLCLACKQQAGDVDKDNPPGYSTRVILLKDNMNICKPCFYVKRGSLNNMPVPELVQHLCENPEFADKFARMRSSSVHFTVMYPSKRYRHEKPDMKLLLERKESDYVDVSAVMKWQSLKRFCDLNFSAMKFKNDMARKSFLLKRGIKLQKDDAGQEGVCVPKDGNGEDEKEVRIGKRLSSSKVRQEDFSDDHFTKEQREAARAKNSAGLTVAANSKAELSAALGEEGPESESGSESDDSKSSASSFFGLGESGPAQSNETPQSRRGNKEKEKERNSRNRAPSQVAQRSPPSAPTPAVSAPDKNREMGPPASRKKKSALTSAQTVLQSLEQASPLALWSTPFKDSDLQARCKKGGAAIGDVEQFQATLPADSPQREDCARVLAGLKSAIDLAPMCQEVFGQLRGKKALDKLKEESFHADLVKVMQSSVMDAETLSSIVVAIGQKVMGQGSILELLKFLSVETSFSQSSSMFSLASLYGHSEKVDLILLQSQPSILHTWVEALKSGPGVLEALSKLDEDSCPACYLSLDEIRLGVPEGFAVHKGRHSPGFAHQALFDLQKLLACAGVGVLMGGTSTLTNAQRLWLKEVASCSSFSSRMTLAFRQNQDLKQLWTKVLSEGNAALNAEALSDSCSKAAATLQAFLAEGKDLDRKHLPVLTQAQLSELKPLAKRTLKAEIKDLGGDGAGEAAAKAAADLQDALGALDSWMEWRGEATSSSASAYITSLWVAGQELVVSPSEKEEQLAQAFRNTSLLLDLLEKKSSLPVAALCTFLERVCSFGSACRDCASESGQMKDRDLLKIATVLIADLTEIQGGVVQVEDPASAEPNYTELLKDTVKRLVDKTNGFGMKWLKDQMADLDSEAAQNVASVAEEIFKPPTEFLKNALLTCSLINKSSKLEDLGKTIGPETTLSGMCDLLSWYVQVVSIERGLMEMLSPDAFAACLEFQKAADARWHELADDFKKTVGNLTALNDKYESVKACAKNWEMANVMWMFNDSKSKDVEADATMMAELRDKVSEDLKSLDRISAVSSTPGATVLAQLVMKLTDTIGLAKDLRHRASLTIGTLMCCDLFLNPTPKPDLAASVNETWKFLGLSLGVTKGDIQNISAKLAAQMEEVLAASTRKRKHAKEEHVEDAEEPSKKEPKPSARRTNVEKPGKAEKKQKRENIHDRQKETKKGKQRGDEKEKDRSKKRSKKDKRDID